MEIEYFKKRSIALNYFGKITSKTPFRSILVIVGDCGFYQIEGTNIPVNDSQSATKEEFEAAYKNAIESFGPIPDVNKKP